MWGCVGIYTVEGVPYTWYIRKLHVFFKKNVYTVFRICQHRCGVARGGWVVGGCTIVAGWWLDGGWVVNIAIYLL